jgi:hypothetical protein
MVAVPGRTLQSSTRRLARWNKQNGIDAVVNVQYDGKSFSTFTELWSKHPDIKMVSWDV